METYLGQIEALVIEQDWLPPEELGVVWRLVEHGEPAEGLCQLAGSSPTAIEGYRLR